MTFKMPFPSCLAGPLIARGSMIAAVLALSALPGLAQTSGQAPKPKQPEPKAQQAQPKAPQPKAQQAQPQNAGPVTVELKAEPSQPEWTKVCGKDQGANAEVCYTTRDFVTDKGQRVVAVAVYDAKAKGAQKVVRILVPLGFLVSPGVRMVVDKSAPVGGRFSSCMPHGCFVEAQVKDDFVNAAKKGSVLNVSARNQVGREVTFVVPVAGFGKAFDGPPVDPKVLAEQQKKLQEELQRRQEELRNRQSSSSGNPAQAPAANAAAPAPQN
jgi:invasion protein IalB